MPDAVELTAAAAVLHDAPTALALFDVTNVGVDDTVLVIGASGGLGLLSVQLARARATRVVAVARSSKLGRVEELGPDVAIDSDQSDWVDRARAALGPRGADVVLDNIGGDVGEAGFLLAAEGGRFSGHGTPSGRFAEIDPAVAAGRGVKVTGIESVQMSDAALKSYTDLALREVEAGTIAPVIGQTFRLDEAAAAHAAIEGRTVFGKTLLLTAE